MNYLKRLVAIARGQRQQAASTTKSLNTETTTTTTTTTTTSEPHPEGYDLIGPADKVSNIRAYRYYVPPDESRVESDYRLLRQQVNEFNHQYWLEQNLKFVESRKIYLRNLRIEQRFMRGLNNTSKNNNESTSTSGGGDQLSATELNNFYKKFLDDNYQLHYDYNAKWFRLNMSLLWPAVRVFFHRLTKQRSIAKRPPTN